MTPIKDHPNKSELARQLGTTRQQIQQWCKSKSPVFIHEGHIYRQLK